jgi:hypothetical protein
MAQLQAYVNVPASSLILGVPLNTSFQQLFSVLNNINGSGIDFTNIGTAGLNASQFNAGSTNINTSTWGMANLTINGAAIPRFYTSSNAAAASGATSNPGLFIGRVAQPSGVLWLGGATTAVPIGFNVYGANEFIIGSPIYVGYQGCTSAQTAVCPPVFNASGAQVGSRLVWGRNIAVPYNYAVPSPQAPQFQNSSSFIVLTMNNGNNALFSWGIGGTGPGGTYGFEAYNSGSYNVPPISNCYVSWIGIGY